MAADGLSELQKIAAEMEAKATRLFVDLAKPAMQAGELAAGELRVSSNEMFSHRTGELARSWRPMFLKVSRTQLVVAALSDLVYAGIQNDGGVIVPRTRKYLAIPARDFTVGKWPRDFGNALRFFQFRSGTKALVMAKPGNSRQGSVGMVMFWLKKSVTITGRHYIEKAARIVEPRVVELLERALARSLGGGG